MIKHIIKQKHKHNYKVESSYVNNMTYDDKFTVFNNNASYPRVKKIIWPRPRLLLYSIAPWQSPLEVYCQPDNYASTEALFQPLHNGHCHLLPVFFCKRKPLCPWTNHQDGGGRGRLFGPPSALLHGKSLVMKELVWISISSSQFSYFFLKILYIFCLHGKIFWMKRNWKLWIKKLGCFLSSKIDFLYDIFPTVWTKMMGKIQVEKIMGKFDFWKINDGTVQLFTENVVFFLHLRPKTFGQRASQKFKENGQNAPPPLFKCKTDPKIHFL